MFRWASRAAVLGGLAAVAAVGAPAAAQDAGPGTVRDLRLPILDLGLPVSSLDGSVTQADAGRETRITLSADVLFRVDRADLSSRARSRLRAVAADVRRAGARTVAVTGHTDSRGSDAYNQRLSERRAEAVRRQLARSLDGVDLRARGRGERDPVASETKAQGDGARALARARSANRRVEIRLPRG